MRMHPTPLKTTCFCVWQPHNIDTWYVHRHLHGLSYQMLIIGSRFWRLARLWKYHLACSFWVEISYGRRMSHRVLVGDEEMMMVRCSVHCVHVVNVWRCPPDPCTWWMWP
jgi:hypothetical protein